MALPVEVSTFVNAASELDVAAFSVIRRAVAEATAEGRLDASDAPNLSASEFGELDAYVRAAFASRAEELRAVPGGLRSAIAQTELAAQSIWKRDRASEDLYEGLVGPFRAAGIPQV